MDDLLHEFLADSLQRLGEIERAMVAFDRRPADAALLADILRSVHTLKGTSGFLGLNDVVAAAHGLEDALVRVRDRKASATAEIVSGITKALRRLGSRIEAIASTSVAAAAATALDRSGDEPVGQPARKAGRHELPAERRPADPTDTLPAAPAEPSQHGDCGALGRAWSARDAPLHAALRHLPRLVERLASQLGKAIGLDLRVTDIALDRPTVRALGEALDHLVRNAADHGIERPAERRRLGKPESGRIAIEAHRSHGHLVVEIRDDGRGLDHGRIADAAVSRGLVGIADAARLSVARLERQIFAPGLSTAASTSLVSGRGVGLDAARTAIERLGGSIAVDSTRGCGTRFTIRLPLPEMVTPAGESQPGPTAGSAFTRQGSSGNDKAGGGEVAAAKGSAEILRRTATPGGFTRDLQKDHES